MRYNVVTYNNNIIIISYHPIIILFIISKKKTDPVGNALAPRRPRQAGPKVYPPSSQCSNALWLFLKQIKKYVEIDAIE